MAKILVADDSRLLRMNLKAIFKKHGHEVVAEASTGQEVLKLYPQVKPDLVTMDISMPDLDGLEATRLLLQIDSEAKVIMISSERIKETILQAIELGVKDYIAKPVTEQKLIVSLMKVLGTGDGN